MKYTIFFDESGSFAHAKRSLIAGYILPDGDLDKWKAKAEDILEEVCKEFNITRSLIGHRTDIKKNALDATLITEALFNKLPSSVKFAAITDDSPEHTHDVYYWYVSLAAALAGEILFTLIPRSEESIEEVRFVLAARKDIQKNVRVEMESYTQAFEQAIDDRLLRLGISRENLKVEYVVHNAESFAPLVIADHFCNTLYNRKKDDKKLIESLKEKNMILLDRFYGEIGDELYDIKRDYYNMISAYIRYKRMGRIGGRYQKIATKSLEKLLPAMKFKKLQDELYFTVALRSYLQYIENESNTLYNYAEVIRTYGYLLDLIQKLEHKQSEELQFVVRTECLAAANHSGNTQLAQECISQNNRVVNDMLVDPAFFPSPWVFNNIKSINLNPMYMSREAIQEFSEAVLKRKLYGEWLAALSTELGTGQKEKDEELGKLYGSLGQAYMVEYMLRGNPADKEKSIEAFNLSKANFDDKKEHSIRLYNYLMHLARIDKNEQSFLEYLSLLTGEDQPLAMVKKASLMNDNYLKAEILAGAVLFSGDIFKEIRGFIKENKSLFLSFIKIKNPVHVRLVRDWAYLLYIENKSAKGVGAFTDAYAYLGAKGEVPPYSLLKVSLLLADFEITGDRGKVKNILTLLEKTVESGEAFREVFSPLICNSSAKDWPQNLKDMLYY